MECIWDGHPSWSPKDLRDSRSDSSLDMPDGPGGDRIGRQQLSGGSQCPAVIFEI